MIPVNPFDEKTRGQWKLHLFYKWSEPIKIPHDDSIKEGEVVGVDEVEFIDKKCNSIYLLPLIKIIELNKDGMDIIASRKPVKVEEKEVDYDLLIDEQIEKYFEEHICSNEFWHPNEIVTVMQRKSFKSGAKWMLNLIKNQQSK